MHVCILIAASYFSWELVSGKTGSDGMFGKVRELFHKNTETQEDDMYIIVGLGNPDRQYQNTRHNIGFDVIDKLAEQEKIRVIERKHKALIGKGMVEGIKVILAKPQTYMNLSGESVRALLDYYKADETADLIVISTISVWMWDSSASGKGQCRRA